MGNILTSGNEPAVVNNDCKTSWSFDEYVENMQSDTTDLENKTDVNNANRENWFMTCHKTLYGTLQETASENLPVAFPKPSFECNPSNNCVRKLGKGTSNHIYTMYSERYGTPVVLRISKYTYEERKRSFDEEAYRMVRMMKRGVGPKIYSINVLPQCEHVHDMIPQIDKWIDNYPELRYIEGCVVTTMAAYVTTLYSVMNSPIPKYQWNKNQRQHVSKTISRHIHTTAHTGTIMFNLHPKHVILDDEIDIIDVKLVDFRSEWCEEFDNDCKEKVEAANALMHLIFEYTCLKSTGHYPAWKGQKTSKFEDQKGQINKYFPQRWIEKSEEIIRIYSAGDMGIQDLMNKLPIYAGKYDVKKPIFQRHLVADV